MMEADHELEEKIAELREEFGSLLDQEALKKLALEELGRLVINKKNIADLKNREGVSLSARIVKIYDVREFNRKDGSIGRVRNLLIEDDTGSCKFSLWDDDVELAGTAEISEGRQLNLVNCFVKISDYGVEVTKGRMGRIEFPEDSVE
jgi:replication factor A1